MPAAAVFQVINANTGLAHWIQTSNVIGIADTFSPGIIQITLTDSSVVEVAVDIEALVSYIWGTRANPPGGIRVEIDRGNRE